MSQRCEHCKSTTGPFRAFLQNNPGSHTAMERAYCCRESMKSLIRQFIRNAQYRRR